MSTNTHNFILKIENKCIIYIHQLMLNVADNEAELIHSSNVWAKLVFIKS